MIQLLTYNGSNDELEGDDILVNKIHDARSLDDYSINVINLNDELIWKNNGTSNNVINSIKDLKSLGVMIDSSDKSNIVIILPQNITFKYYWGYNGKGNNEYLRQCELKDMISTMKNEILSALHTTFKRIKVIYEITKTEINSNELFASFSFVETEGGIILTKSKISNKPTTIKYGNIILTTLKIEDYTSLKDFLSETKLIQEKYIIPDWFKEIQMFDDATQKETIKLNNDTILIAEENIKKAENVLERNERYKSILYTSGDELVSVIFDIFKEIFEWNLDSFKDVKEEDFNIEYDNKVYIGEIKGITSNVKNANVSQLDNHVQNYLDEHDIDPGKIKSLLIINHQRSKALNNREKVNDKTVALAKRNGSLIIETFTLLKMFEKYLNDELSKADCLRLINSNTGLLKI